MQGWTRKIYNFLLQNIAGSIKLYIYTIISCLLIALLYLQLSPATYKATADITLKKVSGRQPAGRSDPDADDNQSLSSYDLKKLMEKAIIKHQLQTSYFKEGFFSDSPLAAYELPFTVKIFNRIVQDKEYEIEVISRKKFKLYDQKPVGRYAFNQTVFYSGMEFKVLKNKNPVNAAEKIKVKIAGLNKLLTGYLDRTDLKTVNADSDRITLSFTDTDPVTASNIVAEISKSYTDDNTNSNELSATVKFINTQLDSINQKLLAYKQEIELLKSTKEQDQTGLDEAKPNMAETKKQIEILKAIEPYVSTPNDQFSFVPNTFGLKNKVIEILITKLNDSQITKQQLLKSEQQGSPVLDKADKDLIVLKNVTTKEIDKEMQRLSSLSDRKTNAVNTPETRADLNRIYLQQRAQVKLYLYLLQKREDAKSSMAGVKFKNIEPAVFIEKKQTAFSILLIGLVTGCICCVPIALYNYRSKTINGIDDLEEITELPVLGNLNNFNRPVKIIRSFEYDAIIGRQLSWITSHLLNITQFQKQQVISVNSINPREGKSFVGNNMALYLASINKRVLLIQTANTGNDLNQLFKLTHAKGLTDFLESANRSVKSFIQKTGETDLHLLLAGRRNVDLNTDLRSERFLNVLNDLKKEYAHIIFDGPSILYPHNLWVINNYADVIINVILNRSTLVTQLQSLKMDDPAGNVKLFLVLNNTPVNLS